MNLRHGVGLAAVCAALVTARPQALLAQADAESGETRLPFSGYMDFHFNKPRGQPGELDLHRFVLLFAHSFTDRIKFWSELEIEHAFLSSETRGDAEIALEQAYLDFLITPAFNVRAGLLLAPVGLINERHEAPAFNGVERPFVDTFIIPTTWFDAGAGVVGDLGRGLTYRAYLMAPMNAAAFTAEEGLRDSSQHGAQAVVRDGALTGRLEYRGVRRLVLGGSVWRGKTGFALRDLNPAVAIAACDGRYRIGRLDFRGEFANVTISQAAALNVRIEQQTGRSPNVGEQLRGFYLESAARVLPRAVGHDLALFIRYENFDTQHRMPPGYLPLKQFDREAWVFGATYYPDPDVALKMDYSLLRNQSAVVKPVSSFNVGLGWWF